MQVESKIIISFVSRSVATFPSQVSLCTRHGRILLPPLSKGRSNRGITLRKIASSSSRISWSSPWAFSFVVYRSLEGAREEFLQVSVHSADRGTKPCSVAIWKPYLPFGDAVIWCNFASPRANFAASGNSTSSISTNPHKKKWMLGSEAYVPHAYSLGVKVRNCRIQCRLRNINSQETNALTTVTYVDALN